MKRLISSVGYNQADMINDIIELHLDGQPFDCDPTYSTGNFYKSGVPEPKHKFDLVPQAEGVVQADCRSLPLSDESIGSIIFDPPFLQRSGKGSIMKERFGDYKTMYELWDMYTDALKEFYRVLRPNGVVVFKCQDTVSCGKNWLSHNAIHNMALSAGFYPKDVFILLAKSRMGQWNLKKQQHARKYHSYFLVFEKKKCSVRYPAVSVF